MEDPPSDGSAAEGGRVEQLDPEGVGDGEDASRRVVERRSRVVLPALAADRPRGDDVPLPRARALTELDGQRGQDNDLSAMVDRLNRVRAWAVEHCPRKQRIVGLRCPRGGDQRAVPDLTGVNPQAVLARRPADKHVGNLWCAKPTYLRVAISASSTVGAGGACA